MIKLLRNTLLTVAIASSLATTGCATMPSDNSLPDVKQVFTETNTDWEAIPPMRKIHAHSGLKIQRPNALPASLRDVDINIKLTRSTTIEDFMVALSTVGITGIVEDDEIGSMSAFIPHFEGKLGRLLAGLSKAKDIAFEYHDGMLIAKQHSQYIISMPQDKDLLESIASELNKLGARDIAASMNAAVISYNATPKTQSAISSYLHRITRNAGMVNLQVAIVNVSLDRQNSSGIDWHSLQGALGEAAMLATTGDEASDAIGKMLSFTGKSATFNVKGKNFDFTGMLNFLSSYGDARTLQRLSLQTIPGKEVKMRSGTSIPYVSGVNVTTSADSLLGSAETSNAETGLNITFQPAFDYDSELVTIDIEMDLKSVLSFTEISAGNQIGAFTQPTTQDQSFNDTVRLAVGETAIIGGLTFEQSSNNYTTPYGTEGANIASKSGKVSKNAMFIVVRPTVTVYANFAEHEADEKGGMF